ncbi:MAG: hypothetical protein P8I02_01650 [Flavobacteriales bacterium]|nr:hypothetical protein [Flavobacteriales bacterium]
MIFITSDGIPEDFTSKLRIRSTEFIIDLEILSKLSGKFSPLMLAELEIIGESSLLIISFNSFTGDTLKEISFKSLARNLYLLMQFGYITVGGESCVFFY